MIFLKKINLFQIKGGERVRVKLNASLHNSAQKCPNKKLGLAHNEHRHDGICKTQTHSNQKSSMTEDCAMKASQSSLVCAERPPKAGEEETAEMATGMANLAAAPERLLHPEGDADRDLHRGTTSKGRTVQSASQIG